ncbi:MAG: hypothetical protein KA392_12770 [Candidatus Obscuribacter sp.]|jgi:hypothetical protein|nr:hypothetical protein [Candidatus Obscuribacter sp.]MDQ5967164.1 hypothetical protein [Cyanobacteriota bacterium erpe_2018_sw_39hr_WHONDRS-SW48-000098_B_bin.30]
MSLLKHIIAIMCTFLVATECQASEPQMPDLSIRSIIQSVTPAIETSNALLELRFLNRSTRPVSIPFVALSGKGQPSIKSKLSISGGHRNEFVAKKAACAVITYGWFDSKGKSVLSRSTLFTHSSLSLSPNGYQSVYIPIEAPISDDLHELKVTFDNRNLQTLSTTNFHNKSEKFFEISTAVNVTE